MKELRQYQTIGIDKLATKFSLVFYIYLHIRPDTNEVFYVGKGKERRAYHVYNRNKHWQRVVAKNAGRFIVQIVADNLTHEEANAKEIELIASYGIENLCNITVGGEGNYGWIPSEETKSKISSANKGKVVSESTRQRLSAIVTGTIKGPRPQEVKEKISKANSGENNGMYGKPMDARVRQLLNTAVSGENNYLAKPIINLQTGIFYSTLQEAADTIPMKRGTLWSMIAGVRKNKTSFIYA